LLLAINTFGLPGRGEGEGEGEGERHEESFAAAIYVAYLPIVVGSLWIDDFVTLSLVDIEYSSRTTGAFSDRSRLWATPTVKGRRSPPGSAKSGFPRAIIALGDTIASVPLAIVSITRVGRRHAARGGKKHESGGWREKSETGDERRERP